MRMGACGVRDVVRMDAGELSDSEGATDQSDCESEVVRVCVPGFLKRTYGVDLASDASLERRRKSAKLDEQLDGLRAVLPDVTTRSRERTNVVLDAYHYIAALQREVEDLDAELLEDAAVAQARGDDDEQQQYCCEGQWNLLLSCQSGLRQQPLVDVARGDGLLEVRIVCANRPGLLVDVMEAVEARGLTIVQVRIACRDEIVVEYLTLESEDSEIDLLSDGEKKADSSGDEEEEEVDRVKAMLVHAICRGGNFGSEDLQ